MTSLPPFPMPPALPLSDADRAVYQNLYDEYETAIEASNDPAVLLLLRDPQTSIDSILTKDTMYKMHQNSAAFEGLTEQINDTNDDLVVLKGEIASVASKIATAGTILAAIDKVLSLSGI